MTLISIVVPSYNQGAYIRETLDSILAQDHPDLEVLVIDGASKDETVDVLRSYSAPNLQWWSEPDKGVVEAVNKGLARAKGEIIGIQSSDDLYLPGALAAIAKEFANDPELALVYGDVEYIDAQSRVTSRTELPPFDLHQYIGKIVYIPQPSAFFRASAMRAAGLWREDISYAADAEFYLRIARNGKAKKIDCLLARYRYHDAQRDKEGVRVPRDWAKAIEPYTRDRDARIRRLARGGIWMTRHHYTDPSRWLLRTWYAYRMLLTNPALWTWMDRRDLLPARYPIWRFLSRLKRRLGFRPRGT
jgi:glycosyltransferase involved in cell wall biosynthesis